MNYHMGDCQNYGPFLGSYYNTGPNTGPNLGDPKRDHDFDYPPYACLEWEILSPETPLNPTCPPAYGPNPPPRPPRPSL